MRASAEAFDIPLTHGEDLGALRYSFATDRAARAGHGVRAEDAARRAARDDRARRRRPRHVDSPCRRSMPTAPCALVVAPWFLYERLAAALDEIREAPLALTLFGKQPHVRGATKLRPRARRAQREPARGRAAVRRQQRRVRVGPAGHRQDRDARPRDRRAARTRRADPARVDDERRDRSDPREALDAAVVRARHVRPARPQRRRHVRRRARRPRRHAARRAAATGSPGCARGSARSSSSCATRAALARRARPCAVLAAVAVRRARAAVAGGRARARVLRRRGDRGARRHATSCAPSTADRAGSSACGSWRRRASRRSPPRTASSRRGSSRRRGSSCAR